MTNTTLNEQAPRVGLVLAGGAAKGSFEAGAVQTLVEGGVRFSRIVGASSGAINGLVLASATRARSEQDAVRVLIDLWRDRATWGGFVGISPLALLRAEGVSTTHRLDALARDVVKPCTTAPEKRRPIDFRAVVTCARGKPASIANAGIDATTYEAVCTFRDDDFDHEPSLTHARRAAVASATLPGILVPSNVPELGPCFDGGLVNNNPISLALDQTGERLDTVIVVTPFPATGPLEDAPVLRGVALAGHLFEVLINERLFRDLKEATRRNAALESLSRLIADGVLSPDQHRAVLAATGWSASRRVRIIAIRPPRPLEGDAFRAFSSRAMRESYIEAGRRAAEAAVIEVSRT